MGVPSVKLPAVMMMVMVSGILVMAQNTAQENQCKCIQMFAAFCRHFRCYTKYTIDRGHP